MPTKRIAGNADVGSEQKGWLVPGVISDDPCISFLLVVNEHTKYPIYQPKKHVYSLASPFLDLRSYATLPIKSIGSLAHKWSAA
jgi:hypothetical protein